MFLFELIFLNGNGFYKNSRAICNMAPKDTEDEENKVAKVYHKFFKNRKLNNN